MLFYGNGQDNQDKRLDERDSGLEQDLRYAHTLCDIKRLYSVVTLYGRYYKADPQSIINMQFIEELFQHFSNEKTAELQKMKTYYEKVEVEILESLSQMYANKEDSYTLFNDSEIYDPSLVIYSIEIGEFLLKRAFEIINAQIGSMYAEGLRNLSQSQAYESMFRSFYTQALKMLGNIESISSGMCDCIFDKWGPSLTSYTDCVYEMILANSVYDCVDANDKYIICSNHNEYGSIRAIDKTGIELWTYRTTARIIVAPKMGDDTIYVLCEDSQLIALDATGTPRGSYKSDKEIVTFIVNASNLTLICFDSEERRGRDCYLFEMISKDNMQHINTLNVNNLDECDLKKLAGSYEALPDKEVMLKPKNEPQPPLNDLIKSGKEALFQSTILSSYEPSNPDTKKIISQEEMDSRKKLGLIVTLMNSRDNDEDKQFLLECLKGIRYLSGFVVSIDGYIVDIGEEVIKQLCMSGDTEVIKLLNDKRHILSEREIELMEKLSVTTNCVYSKEGQIGAIINNNTGEPIWSWKFECRDDSYFDGVEEVTQLEYVKFVVGEDMVAFLQAEQLMDKISASLILADRKEGELLYFTKCNNIIDDSICLSEDRCIYLTTDGYLYVLDCNSGFSSSMFRLTQSVAMARIFITDEGVISLIDQQQLYAIEPTSERVKWQYSCEASVLPDTITYYRSSLLFADQQASIQCIDSCTGKPLWKVDLMGFQPVSLTISGQTVIAITQEGFIKAFNLDNGDSLWESKHKHPTDRYMQQLYQSKIESLIEELEDIAGGCEDSCIIYTVAKEPCTIVDLTLIAEINKMLHKESNGSNYEMIEYPIEATEENDL